MPWPFRRNRPPTPPVGTDQVRSAPAPTGAAVERPPSGAWAHMAPFATPLATPPLTFRGDRFGRSVAGARPMASPPIPPLHHRVDPAGPRGILTDVASRAAIVRDEPTPPRSTAGSADMPIAATVRRAPTTSVAVPARDLLHSELDVAFATMPPSRTVDGGVDTPLEAMSWDAEHGFRTTKATSTLRMLRRRPASPGASTPDGITDDQEPWSSTTPVPEDGEVSRAALRYVAAPGPRIDRPPSDLVDVVRLATGVDVTGVRIDRSPEVTERAAAMGAIAFTDGDTVHLPSELGPHDEGSTRAVLAHELTHVAQRRSGAGPTPDEHSADGIELEHQARAVQRAVDDRTPVVPSFLRTAPVSPTTPRGVQRLGTDENRFDWQHRGAPPSERGARAAFGFGFMRHDPDSAEGRGQAVADRQWAERYEADNATDLQRQRDERYAEMVAEAEREIQIRNLREERTGDEVLELERRDILSLRRRLDEEMPWEFGPPADIIDRLYPDDPPLPPEPPPGQASAGTGAATGAGATALTAGAATVASAAAHAGHAPTLGAPAPDAPTIGRESAARRSPPLRHPSVARTLVGSSAEPDTSWQHRPSTTREQIGAVFGGTLGQLLAGSVSDADDEAERRRAESADEVMDRRRARERELRHVELRGRSMAARRRDESGAVTLDPDAIALIRQTVDTEMPLEFVLPAYLENDVDVHIDAEGTIGPAVAAPATTEAGADTDHAAAQPPETDLGSRNPGLGEPSAADATDAGTTAADSARPALGDSSVTDVEDPAPATGEPSATAAPPTDTSPSLAPALAAGEAVGALATHLDHDDDQTAASRVFDAASDLDLDQLARRLYGRFRRDLRRELLIDRERAGTLADAC